MDTAALDTPMLLDGRVFHARLWLRRHRLQYRVYYLWLPLHRLDQVPGVRHNRFAAFSIRDRDYGPRDGSPLEPWIRERLAGAGIPLTAKHQIVLLTMPRTFWFGFNPVSFWLVFAENGALQYVLNEVNNTVGQHHFYLCRPAADGTARADKVFHVSPFFDRRGHYLFRYRMMGDRCSILIDYHAPGGGIRLKTGLGGRLIPLGHKVLWRFGLRFPLQTALAWTRIHWHAVRLMLKGIKHRKKPEQVQPNFTAGPP